MFISKAIQALQKEQIDIFINSAITTTWFTKILLSES